MIARRATFPAAWKYLLPCCLIFGLYLLAFYPGLFSEDSWILWRQITDHSGSPQRSMQAHEAAWYRPVLEQPFNSFLPLANTLLCWLATRVWRSPAAICALQAIALAAAFSAAMLHLERRGSSRAVRFAIALVVIAFPLNGFYAVTLWKDVLYGAALLWMTVLMADAGTDDRGRRGAAVLGIATAAVWLGRPNGPAAAMAGLLVLAAVSGPRIRVLQAAAVSATLIFAVEVPLSRMVGENHDGEGFYRASPFVFDIGAVLDAGGRVGDRQRATLARFEDLGEWRERYRPYLFPYWISTRAHWLLLDEPDEFSKFIHAWAGVARENPGIVLRHRWRAATVGWRVVADATPLYVIPAEMDRGRRVPLRAVLDGGAAPPLPALTGTLTALANATIFAPGWGWLFACPAVWTYLAIAGGIVYRLRARSPVALAVLAPLVANWLATSAFCMAQDVRYFYPAFLIAPILVGLALLPHPHLGSTGPARPEEKEGEGLQQQIDCDQQDPAGDRKHGSEAARQLR